MIVIHFCFVDVVSKEFFVSLVAFVSSVSNRNSTLRFHRFMGLEKKKMMIHLRGDAAAAAADGPDCSLSLSRFLFIHSSPSLHTRSLSVSLYKISA